MSDQAPTGTDGTSRNAYIHGAVPYRTVLYRAGSGVKKNIKTVTSLSVSIGVQCEPGAVLAPAEWGVQGSPKGAGHRKNLVGYMYKYAVFDIKLAYNH